MLAPSLKNHKKEIKSYEKKRKYFLSVNVCFVNPNCLWNQKFEEKKLFDLFHFTYLVFFIAYQHAVTI